MKSLRNSLQAAQVASVIAQMQANVITKLAI